VDKELRSTVATQNDENASATLVKRRKEKNVRRAVVDHRRKRKTHRTSAILKWEILFFVKKSGKSCSIIVVKSLVDQIKLLSNLYRLLFQILVV